jgi:hypothetical protein
VLKLSHNQELMDDHGHFCGLKLGLHLPWNRHGTKGNRAKVSNEAHDEKIPPIVLNVFFWTPLPFFKLWKGPLNGSIKPPNGPTKLINTVRRMLQNGYSLTT